MICLFSENRVFFSLLSSTSSSLSFIIFLFCLPLSYVTKFIVSPFQISVYVLAPWYPFYRATKYFNKGWIKTNTGFFSESSLSWPAGTYGIPKPQSGCPKTDYFHWLEGWRSQGSNSTNLNNSRSAEFHLDGKVDNTMVNRSFCIKDNIIYDSVRPAWPKGLFWYFFSTRAIWGL